MLPLLFHRFRVLHQVGGREPGQPVLRIAPFASIGSASAGADGTLKRILFIEDEADIRMVARMALEAVAQSELESVCGSHPGMYLHGCAKRDYAARICTIVTGPEPQAWLLDHERKHCDGWDHGEPRTVAG